MSDPRLPLKIVLVFYSTLGPAKVCYITFPLIYQLPCSWFEANWILARKHCFYSGSYYNHKDRPNEEYSIATRHHCKFHYH